MKVYITDSPLYFTVHHLIPLAGPAFCSFSACANRKPKSLCLTWKSCYNDSGMSDLIKQALIRLYYRNKTFRNLPVWDRLLPARTDVQHMCTHANASTQSQRNSCPPEPKWWKMLIDKVIDAAAVILWLCAFHSLSVLLSESRTLRSNEYRSRCPLNFTTDDMSI